MPEEILINVTPREVRVALLENGTLQEIHIERSLHQGLLGNIYKGRVSRLLPGIQAAFVDIGAERSAFLHISDVAGYAELATEQNPAELDIRDLLYVGQDLLVQVYKDPLGTKGARLTTHITIPSRYIVLTPGTYQMAVSQKITDEVEQQRLLSLIELSEEGGYIFRTAAEGVTQEEVNRDKLFLDAMWTEIKKRAQQAKPATLVQEELPIVLRVLRDFVGYNVERIRVDNETIVSEMRQFAVRYVPNLMNRIEFYSSRQPIFDLYSVEDMLQKALQRKVSLKSGGSIIFDQTEAMTTIDVNTGSYHGHNNNLEQTILKTNLEAVEAIAHQVRLRNLGGIIIIDFIDMEDPIHKEHLLSALKTALAKDSTRTEISELSSLGLVQMTRKRTRDSLEHTLCVPCPVCQARGSVKSYASIVYEIFREIKRAAELYAWGGFMIVGAPNVIHYLKDEESGMLADLEIQLGRPIQLREESFYFQERYDILPLSEKE